MIFLILLFLGFLVPVCLSAQPSEGFLEIENRERIAWGTFREKVRSALPDFVLEDLKVQRSRNQLNQVYDEGDLFFQAGGNFRLVSNGASELPNQWGASGSLSKKLVPSGTTLSVGTDFMLSRNYTGAPGNQTSIVPRLKVSQDLLRNFFGVLSRLKITTAERRVAIAESQRSSTERLLLKAYDNYYLEWALLWRQRELLLAQEQRSLDSYQNAQEQFEVNYIDVAVLQRFHDRHLQYQISLLENQNALSLLEERFKAFLGETNLPRPDLDELRFLWEQLPASLPDLLFQDSWIWDISRQNLDLLEITYETGKRQLSLPQLNLGAFVDLKSIDPAGDGNLGPIKPEFGAEITLSFPILGRSAENQLDDYENQIAEVKEQIRKQEMEFTHSVRGQRIFYRTLLEKYDLLGERIQAQREVYEETEVQYSRALANIRDLLDADINLISQRLQSLTVANQLLAAWLNYLYETKTEDILSGTGRKSGKMEVENTNE